MLQRHVSYHWTTSQKLRKKSALILVRRKGPSGERLPRGRDRIRGTHELWGGVKQGVDSRPAARERGYFGPGPDELTFQARQLRPPRENGPLKVVFGRLPSLQWERWPRAKKIHLTAFPAPCQSWIRRNSGLTVGLAGEYRKPWINEEAMPPGKVGQWIYFLASADPETPAPPKKKGNIRPQARCQFEPLPRVQAVAGKLFQAEQRDRCVAAATSQARARWDPLLEKNPNPAPELSRAFPKRASPVDQIRWTSGNGWVLAFDDNPARCFV